MCSGRCWGMSRIKWLYSLEYYLKEILFLYRSTHVVSTDKSKSLQQVGQVIRMCDIRKEYKILMGNFLEDRAKMVG